MEEKCKRQLLASLRARFSWWLFSERLLPDPHHTLKTKAFFPQGSSSFPCHYFSYKRLAGPAQSHSPSHCRSWWCPPPTHLAITATCLQTMCNMGRQLAAPMKLVSGAHHCATSTLQPQLIPQEGVSYKLSQVFRVHSITDEMGTTHKRRQKICTWESACWSLAQHWVGPLSSTELLIFLKVVRT